MPMAGNETRPTIGPGTDVSAKWSPDGRIFFASNREGKLGIYVMDADGTNVTRFTKAGAAQPACSPNGRQVAFIGTSLERINSSFPLQIFVADANGGNVRMITRTPASTFVPCWSPDGATIVFAIDDFGIRSNILQIDQDGSNRGRLTAGPKIDAQPAISPDGSKLAFQSNRGGNYEIYIMNLR
jgi:TolB protein